jgi:hypothetical protein
MALSQGVNEDAPAASFDDAIFLRRFVKDPDALERHRHALLGFHGAIDGQVQSGCVGLR